MRDSDTAKIYTSDRTVMTRLDRLAEREDCPDWKVTEEIRDTEGELVGKMYETNKRLVSFRSFLQSRELTDEQREAGAERLRLWREKEQAKRAAAKEEGNG